MSLRASLTLELITKFAVLNTERARDITSFTVLVLMPISGESIIAIRLAGLFASLWVEHQEVGVVNTLPASSANVLCGGVAICARVGAEEEGLEDKVGKPVLDVVLICVVIRLDDKAITGVVGDWVLNVFNNNCDFVFVSSM